MQHAETSAWTADVFSELIAFFDADCRLEAMGFDGESRAHLRANFFIVGAAAFQKEWRQNEVSSSIGFRSDQAVVSSAEIARYESAVRSQNVVPDELIPSSVKNRTYCFGGRVCLSQ